MTKQKLIVALAALVIAVVWLGKHPVTVPTIPSSVVISGYTIAFESSVAQAAPQAPVTVATDERSQWAIDLLAALGNNTPTPETIAFVVAWQQAEDNDVNGALARHNPLNTTQSAEGAWIVNSVGVKGYVSRDDGLRATVETLTNGFYPNVFTGLQTNNPEMALNDAELATWGTGLGNVARLYRTTASQPIGDVRHQVVQLALRQVGKPYILGTQGPDTFDCSGLVQWTYAHFGIETGRTTFDQLPRLKSIEPIEIQTGDLMYFQYPWDQHVGILADVNGDGQWDLIEANSPGVGVIVTNDVFDKPLYTDALIGYRSAL